jgi:phosphatidate cytidylyltransferase
MSDKRNGEKSGGAAVKILTGAIMSGAALGLIYLNTLSLYVYDIIIYLASVFALFEMTKALDGLKIKQPDRFRLTVIKPPLILAAAATLISMLLIRDNVGLLGAALLGISLISVLSGGIVYVINPKVAFSDFSATVTTLIYPFFFLSAAYLINHTGGSFLLLFTLLIALMTDTCAYFTGRIFNGIFHGNTKKLIPRVSPNKTVAGAVGGVIGCVLISVLYWFLIERSGVIDLKYTMSDVISADGAWILAAYVLIALFGSAVSQFGDLFASRIKRECGIKDFGSLIPGHGGVIDRVDAVMFSIAAVYIVTVIF